MYIFTKGCIVQKAIEIPLECIYNVFIVIIFSSVLNMKCLFLFKHNLNTHFYFFNANILLAQPLFVC